MMKLQERLMELKALTEHEEVGLEPGDKIIRGPRGTITVCIPKIRRVRGKGFLREECYFGIGGVVSVEPLETLEDTPDGEALRRW